VAFLRSGGCSFNLGRLCGGAGSGGFQVFMISCVAVYS